MKKIFAVWHQAEGVVTSHLFATYPSDHQMAALRRELERRHSRPHMLMAVREAVLLEADELPEFPRPAGFGESTKAAAVPPFGVSGVGAVSTPETFAITAADVGTLVLGKDPR